MQRLPFRTLLNMYNEMLAMGDFKELERIKKSMKFNGYNITYKDDE